MKLSDFDYELPTSLIAQSPAANRSESRLMRVDRESSQISHHRFHDLPNLLKPEDLLVLNDSRVIPARLRARIPRRSGKIEVLLIRQLGPDEWVGLVRPGRKARTGTRLIFEKGSLEADVLGSEAGGPRRLRFSWRGDFWSQIERLGETPLPPYIRRDEGASQTDRERYQTVYARQRGSVAAPTAGLHFTPEMLDRIAHCSLTLHVGYGTFQPVRSEDVREHQIDPESFEISSATADTIERHRQLGKRVIAVGSTSTRVLEHSVADSGQVKAGSGRTGLFLYPGYKFKVVGGLLTNFHLPRSSLLLLVSAFAGTELIREAYREAITNEYRFYSYGDAMLIL